MSSGDLLSRTYFHRAQRGKTSIVTSPDIIMLKPASSSESKAGLFC